MTGSGGFVPNPQPGPEIRAAALREAADEVHREARWQQECKIRGNWPTFSMGDSIERLRIVESILLNVAAELSGGGSRG